MQVICAGATHKGCVRENNEDNIYVDGKFREDLNISNVLFCPKREENYHTLAVFDGVGGAEHGERISYICSSALEKVDGENLYLSQKEFLLQLNEAVCKIIKEEGEGSMGSTAAMVSIVDGKAYACNIGDSRIYVYSDNELKQVSHDHTSVQSMIDNGVISESERKNNKLRHTLIQYIGSDDECELEPYMECINIKSEDIVLLCSDGLTDMVENSDIKDIIESNKKKLPESIVAELLNAAVEKGGKDNISIIIASIN